MTTSQRIRKVRKEQLGLTQSELAQILRVESVTVSRWERGVEPSTRNLRALAKLADIPLSYFYEGEAA